MKTRKLISGVFLLGCLLSGSRTNAQEINYYTGDRIKVYDKVYIINRPQDYMKNAGFVEIWDSANVKKMFAPQYYPNGEEIPFYHGHFERLQYQDREKIKEAVREVFSPEEIQKFKEKEVDLYVEIVVDSTGLIIEQCFDLAEDWPILLSIPPEKLYHLEKKLQEKVRFNVENFEKQFGYTKGKVISIFFKDY